MAAEPAARSRLARLRREIDADVAALDARAAEVAALLLAWTAQGTLPRPELVLVAVNLHGYYTGLETLLERIARRLDDDVPSGPTWHVELLEQMQIEVPGLRPAAIPAACLADLHALRKFRHFFRNAYAVELDPGRVREQAERLGRVHAPVMASLASLRSHVETALSAPGA